MNRRNELFVRGEAEIIRAMIPRLNRIDLLEDWVRDESAEARLNTLKDLTEVTSLCFNLKSGPLRPVSLVLEVRAWGELRVTLVSTTDRKPQTDTEYNRVLGDFLSNVLVPLGVGLKLEFVLQAPRMELGEFMSPVAIDRLYEFLAASTRDGKRPELRDETPWYRFVYQIHHDGAYLDPDDLDYYLKIQEFSDDDRGKLMKIYTNTREILLGYSREMIH